MDSKFGCATLLKSGSGSYKPHEFFCDEHRGQQREELQVNFRGKSKENERLKKACGTRAEIGASRGTGSVT